MATLSVQIRLGASRGWRVRSLIKAKFYAQSVIHCLFIFSVLRARGFTTRMWTLHYAVFTNNSRYFIHVEYFKLPNVWHMLRPPVRQYFTEFVRYKNKWRVYPRRVTLHSLPHAKKVRVFESVFRRRPGLVRQHENLYWSWDRRAYLMMFILTRVRMNSRRYASKSVRKAGFNFA